MRRARFMASVNVPVGPAVQRKGNATDVTIKEEFLDIKEEPMVIEESEPTQAALDGNVVAKIEPQIEITENMEELDDCSGSSKCSDETFRPYSKPHKEKKTKVNLPKKSRGGPQKVDKHMTMFDLIHERKKPAKKRKPNLAPLIIDEDAKKQLIMSDLIYEKRLKKKLTSQVRIEENDSPESVSVSHGKSTPNFKNRPHLDIAGRKLDRKSQVNERGHILNKDKSVRSLYCVSKNTKIWSVEESKNFYKALSVYGCDFSLMRLAFPLRTIAELKAKFKKEDKLNRTMVEDAIYAKTCSEQQVTETMIKRSEENGSSKRMQKITEQEQKPVKELKDIWLEIKDSDLTMDHLHLLVKDSDQKVPEEVVEPKAEEPKIEIVQIEDEKDEESDIQEIPIENPVGGKQSVFLPEAKSAGNLTYSKEKKVNIKFMERDPLDLTGIMGLCYRGKSEKKSSKMESNVVIL